MLDMMKMMGKLKEVQEKMKVAQDGLKNITSSAESGAGLVKAVVNGNKELISLEIDKSIISVNDEQMMKDLIIAAVNMAINSVEIKAKEHMRTATDGVIPNIPGFDLSKMM
jgi:nucleoid-associated protein EbfC